MPMGSLFAWISRGPRRSWGTHHSGCPQGFPLGTHSYLCQLLLNHLQHHVHDVLLIGSSAHYTLSPRLSRHASISHQSSGSRKPRVALHSWSARIPTGARVSWLSTDSLLSLGSWLSRLALLPFLTREAGHPWVTHSASGTGLPWGTLISFDAWQALGSWNSRGTLLSLGARSSLRAWLPYWSPLTLVTLLSHDALRTNFSSRPWLPFFPWRTRDSREALLAWFTLVSRASFCPRLTRHTR